MLRCRCVLIPEGDWFKFYLGHLTESERGCRQSLPADSKFFFYGAAPQRGPWPPHSRWGFLITHNDALQSVGLLWTSDQPVARPLPDNTQHSQQTNFHAFYIYCPVHRNILWNNQQMRQCAVKFISLLVRARLHCEEITETIWDRLWIVPMAVDTVEIVLLMMGVCAARNM